MSISKNKNYTGFTDAFMPKFEVDFAKKHAPKVEIKEKKKDSPEASAKERKIQLQLRRVGLHQAAEAMKNKKPFIGELVRLATNALEPDLKSTLADREDKLKQLLQVLKKEKAKGSSFETRLRDILSEELGDAQAEDIITYCKSEP